MDDSRQIGRSPRLLEYRSGSEHSPGDPFGASSLAIALDGSVRLENRSHGRVRVWEATVGPEVLVRLRDRLSRSGFPAVPRFPVPPGASMRVLEVGSEGEAQQVLVPWHATDELPGYRDLFELLDSIVRQASGDEMQATPDFVPGQVAGARRVSG
jgi:hypothetical protein